MYFALLEPPSALLLALFRLPARLTFFCRFDGLAFFGLKTFFFDGFTSPESFLACFFFDFFDGLAWFESSSFACILLLAASPYSLSSAGRLFLNYRGLSNKPDVL